LSARAQAFARQLTQGILILVVCLVSFETATRMDDWVRFGAPPWSPVAVEEELLTRDSLGEHGKPHARFQKWALNNLGMRGPAVVIVKPARLLRVVTAGASETFGLYESLDREYPRQLEDSLRSALTRDHCDGVRVEVLNAAIFGMTLPSVDQDLRTRVRPLHPDVVVLYPTPAQYLADSTPRAATPAGVSEQDTATWYAVLRPRAVSRLRDQVKGMLPAWTMTLLRQQIIDANISGRSKDWRFLAVPDERLASYDRDLRHIIGTIRAIGARPVIMTHANLFMAPVRADTGERSAQLIAWQRSYPRATAPVLPAFDSAAAAVTLRAARDSDVPAVDLAAAIRDMPPPRATEIFRDYAHFSDAGSAMVAGMLRPVVTEAARASQGGAVSRRADECPDMRASPTASAAGS
jgi:hypothetical protein